MDNIVIQGGLHFLENVYSLNALISYLLEIFILKHQFLLYIFKC